MSRRRSRSFVVFASVAMAAALLSAGVSAQPLGDMTDAELIEWGQGVNAALEADGYNFRLGQIEFFTVGGGRPDVPVAQAKAAFCASVISPGVMSRTRVARAHSWPKGSASFA